MLSLQIALIILLLLNISANGLVEENRSSRLRSSSMQRTTDELHRMLPGEDETPSPTSASPSISPRPSISPPPSLSPTVTAFPSIMPTLGPSQEPTRLPTTEPTAAPTIAPSTAQPSMAPTMEPTMSFQQRVMESPEAIASMMIPLASLGIVALAVRRKRNMETKIALEGLLNEKVPDEIAVPAKQPAGMMNGVELVDASVWKPNTEWQPNEATVVQVPSELTSDLSTEYVVMH
ncbi:expressed unknown protein [Seminavis robusta]|uniref:Uncharacterized protein n=1 Tax=Seminavis robusta TaxID=568900 RepID=A0A9N8H7X9_9STRA|nr:expressed unknown protein [Seminavis robusta]|eukprot:Sro154_g069910.1 n/a (234) ;mRNA; f:22355-23056